MKYALCPSCLSTLQVTEEQLALKEGLIRCGHCNDVFNGHQHQLTPSGQPVANIPIEKPVPTTGLETSTDNDDEPPMSAIWESPSAPVQNRLAFGLLSFTLIIVLLAQVIMLQSDLFTQSTRLQPIFKYLNKTFDLDIPGYINLDEIHIVDREIRPHPELQNALELQITMKNHALTEQAYPSINVTLTSRLGEKIALGKFTKYDYLNKDELNDYFAPSELKHIKLIFSKPRQNPSGFEITFSESLPSVQ
ncbi:MAG: zinc-ribbon and DUF3426 domain-containing protein [Cycloclasticus sp.]|nr:zinc-ribbon and DUF3426 domain-containing protein [Cycloclasticus sp.]